MKNPRRPGRAVVSHKQREHRLGYSPDNIEGPGMDRWPLREAEAV